MRSALLLLSLDPDVDARRNARLPCCRPPLLLLSLVLASREPFRPRCSGLNSLTRLRVLRSRALWWLWRDSTEDRESMLTERLLRFPLASCFFWRRGGGERDGERFVEMVDTESADDDLLLLLLLLLLRLRPAVLRPRSSSFFLRMSSAMPFLRTRSLGTSVVSLGLSEGLSSCCVREGRDL